MERNSSRKLPLLELWCCTMMTTWSAQTTSSSTATIHKPGRQDLEGGAFEGRSRTDGVAELRIAAAGASGLVLNNCGASAVAEHTQHATPAQRNSSIDYFCDNSAHGHLYPITTSLI